MWIWELDRLAPISFIKLIRTSLIRELCIVVVYNGFLYVTDCVNENTQCLGDRGGQRDQSGHR